MVFNADYVYIQRVTKGNLFDMTFAMTAFEGDIHQIARLYSEKKGVKMVGPSDSPIAPYLIPPTTRYSAGAFIYRWNGGILQIYIGDDGDKEDLRLAMRDFIKTTGVKQVPMLEDEIRERLNF